MALSDREQAVLNEMELALAPASTGPAATPRATNRVCLRHFIVAIGLLAAGVASIAVGLRLQDNLGTGLGVLGFALVTGSGWSATYLIAPLRGWAMTRHATPARSSPTRGSH